jgi:hypothetical protein
MSDQNRFDYIKYDDESIAIQQHAKIQASFLADTINELGDERSTRRALTHLEECYMWIGKAIRDKQIARNGEAEMQEQRNES